MKTKPAFFIIESRKIKEESESKRQGRILIEMFNLMGIKSEYRYIRTIKELGEMAKQYYDYNYRYLHISMHGTKNGFSLTLDKIKYKDFCDIVIRKPVSRNQKRRLFISACEVKENVAHVFSHDKNTFMSIIAPATKIKTRTAPLVWSTLYKHVFENEENKIENKMTNQKIKKELESICSFFKVNYRGLFRDKRKKSEYNSYLFPSKKEP